MLPLEFIEDKQVSDYVVKNKLDCKYPSISDVVRFLLYDRGLGEDGSEENDEDHVCIGKNEARRIFEKLCEEVCREAREKEERLKTEEFQALVDEMRPLGFTESSQLSNYIVRNGLGRKYPNISGVVKMVMDEDCEYGMRRHEWNFKGGFPPDIYKELCEALGLSSKKTRARAVGFASYKELESGQRKI